MTQNAKHSPAPIAIDDDEKRDIMASDGRLLASVYPKLDSKGLWHESEFPEAEATAARIVTSYNLHDGLLEALQASLAILKSILGTDLENIIIAEQVAIIDAALAKAGVKP